jgi:hypothetical protein
VSVCDPAGDWENEVQSLKECEAVFLKSAASCYRQTTMDDHAIVQRGLAPRIIREAALALKYGRLALAIEKGRVVRVDRGE